MQNVILVVHIIACLVMIGLVLLQKSEGGGLGIGGGGGANSLMSGRGTAGTLVRSTMIFGALFFVTSLALTSIANRSADNRSGIERVLEQDVPASAPAGPTDLFDPSTTLLNEPQSSPPDTAAPPAPADVLTDPSDAPPAEDAGEPPANPQ